MAAAAFLLGAAIALMYRPFSHIEAGDPAIYDYIAQSILRGQLPYRDVVDIKGPGAAHLSALAILAGELFGLRDIIAIRLLHVLMIGTFCSLTYIVAEAYLRDRLVAAIAFAVPLMAPRFSILMITGTQPKLPMIICGLLALLMIARARPFWAGFFSSLACLFWQPGLLFAGVAFLIFSRYLTSWRDGMALKVLAGTILPIAATAAYFQARGALSDMVAWTIVYNSTVFGPDAVRPFSNALARFLAVVKNVFSADTTLTWLSSHFNPNSALFSILFRSDLLLLAMSAIGLAAFLIERAKVRIKGLEGWLSPELFKDALAMPPLIYLAFCMINFQAGPDTIPFFPFIGMFAGYSIAGLARFINEPRLNHWLPRLSMAAILLVALARAATYKLGGWTLQNQDREIRKLSSVLSPNDKIYVHGSVEILVLLKKPNLNPYVFLDWGADDFAAKLAGKESFKALVEQMEAQAPKIVAISRLNKVRHRQELEQWVKEKYEKIEWLNYDKVYIRAQPGGPKFARDPLDPAQNPIRSSSH